MLISIPEIHSGRFESVKERAQALILNDGGWYGCRNCKQWQDSEVGEPCSSCGTPLQAERRPNRGSRFEAYYLQFAVDHGVKPMRVKPKEHRNELESVCP